MSDHTNDPTESAPRWARPNLSLGLMLLALHAALVLGLGTGASRALLLAHFGLFLLWQPVWQGTRRLVPSRALMVVAGGGALAWWGTWPLLGLWLALLFALIGGNVPGMRALRPRIAPLLAALYLLARSVSTIVLVATATPFVESGWSHELFGGVLRGLALVLPDLARFTQADWLLGHPPTAGLVAALAAQALLYVALLLAAAAIDLYRKNF